MSKQRGGDRGRTRSGSGETEQERRMRQCDYLSFQILLTLALAGIIWLSRILFPTAFETVVRVGKGVLDGDEALVNAVLTPPDLTTILSERFGINMEAVGDFPARYSMKKSTSSGESGEGKGGALPGGALRKNPSPLLLTAKPQVPVSGTVTSRFGWRENPLSAGEEDFHTGLDIAAEEGTVISAALPGTVGDVGFSQSYGNYILIEHANGLQTFYCHCSEIIACVGERIRQGERLARVGSTGYATGPHLHFEIRSDSGVSDPLVQLI